MPMSKSLYFMHALIAVALLPTAVLPQDQSLEHSIPTGDLTQEDDLVDLRIDSPRDQSTGDQNNIDQNNIDQSTADQSTADQTTGDQSTGDQLPSDESSGDASLTGTLLDDMADYHTAMRQRSTELNEKLDHLEKILKNHPACQPKPTAVAPTPPSKNPETPVGSEKVYPTTPTPIESGIPLLPDDSATNTLSVSVLDADPDGDPIWDENASLNTIIITDNVVNRLALANNLYAAGEFKIALQLYQQLQQDSTQQDQQWITYQIAQCHRTLGAKENADQAFRIVTAMPDSKRWGDYSKWWLANGDDVSNVKQRSQQLTAAIERLRSEIDGLK